jgi:hypothetical protein
MISASRDPQSRDTDRALNRYADTGDHRAVAAEVAQKSLTTGFSRVSWKKMGRLQMRADPRD